MERNCEVCFYMKARVPVIEGVIKYRKGYMFCKKGHIKLDRDPEMNKNFSIKRMLVEKKTPLDWETYATNCIDFEEA